MSESSTHARTTWQPPSIDWVVPLMVKRWRFICAVAALIIAAIFVALLLRGSVYEANARLLVKLGRESVNATSISEQNTVLHAKRPEDVKTEIEIMLSPHVLGELVDAFGVDFFLAKSEPRTMMQRVKRFARDVRETISEAQEGALIALGLRRELAPREKIVAVLGRSITAEVLNRSDVIELTMRAPDPQAAVAVLERLIELYIKSHIKAYTNTALRSFFAAETESIHRQLMAAEAERSALKTQGGLWSIAEQRKLLLDWQQQLTADHAATQVKVAASGAETANLEQQAARQPSQLKLSSVERRNEVLDKLRNRLAELNARKAQLENRFEPDSRPVIDVQSEIEQTQRAIKSETELMIESVTYAPNEQRHRLLGMVMERQAQLDGLKAHAARISSQLARVNTELREIETREGEVRRLDRQIQRFERDWNLYTKNLAEAKASEEMDAAKLANVSVISPPWASPEPISPSLKLALIGALLFGFGVPVAWVLFQHLRRPLVMSRADVAQSLGAPVLARIPEMRKGVAR